MVYRLGIDLGTTFTAAAYIEDAGPRMLELGNRNLTIPSVLFVTDEDQFLFGETAERRALSEPERVLREFKRRIGDTVPMMAGQQSHDPVALQAELLRWVLHVANERLGGPPDHVVVTHPASWGLYKVKLMRQIAAAAGVPEATLCPEPVGAAIEYAAKERVPVGAKLAVYDLGGGTFDIAILEKTYDGFTVIGTPLGVDHLGGLDFDEAVLADAVSKLGLHNLDLDDPASTRGLAVLRRDCIEAKEALSSDVTTEITSLLFRAGRPVRLTRSEFESLIRPALEESIHTTERALRLAGVANTDLHAVVLVGGSSRIPLVTELLNHHLGVRVASDTFPKHDIALGAARYASAHRREPTAGTKREADSSREAGSVTSPPAQAGSQRADDTDEPLPAEPALVEQLQIAPTVKSTADQPRRVPAAGMTVAGEPATEELAETAAPDSNERRPQRKLPRALVLATVVAALIIGTGIVINQIRSAGRNSGAAGMSPAQQTSATPQVDSSDLDLPVGPALTDNQLLVPRYFKSAQAAQLWLVDTRNAGASRRLDTVQDGSAYAIGLSPDRRTMTYLDTGANAIRAMPASGGAGRLLFHSPDGCGKIQHASWSPTDLSTFVLECQTNRTLGHRLVVVTDGELVQELDTGQRRSFDPTISPDGKMVTFVGSQLDSGPGEGSILAMPFDGSYRPVNATRSAVDSDPAWSPDGSLAFRRRVGGAKSSNTDIMVIPPGGGTERTLVSGPATDEKPSWSPDGKMLAYVSNRDEAGKASKNVDLWQVSAQGGRTRPLGLASYRFATPTWWHR